MMSREIEFRAYHKKTKQYRAIEHIYFHDGQADFIRTVNLETKHDPWDDVIEDFILEQYTGFKDKNGKKIYEGDRIKIEGSDTVYTVEYGRGVWVARFGDESGDNICLYHYIQKDMVLYAEVIGNIHEPPKDFRPEHLKRMGVSISKGKGRRNCI